MSGEEAKIAESIREWVEAIQRTDLEEVVRERTADVVMFDVPPPERGARGIDAYRDTWPPFFDWVGSGAVFEIDELEVRAGDDVAFAWALLRCGKPEALADDPNRRLRLTLGMVKRDGRWLTSHEHHSFTLEGSD